MTKDTAKQYLLETLKPGDTVYAVRRKASSYIDFYAIEDGRMSWIGGMMALVAGFRYDETHHGLYLRGRTPDDAVMKLAASLFWGNRFALHCVDL